MNMGFEIKKRKERKEKYEQNKKVFKGSKNICSYLRFNYWDSVIINRSIVFIFILIVFVVSWLGWLEIDENEQIFNYLNRSKRTKIVEK